MDGPFAETKEQLGGYCIFDCKDVDEAIAGLELIETALRRGRPGPFKLQAAISAIHVNAPDFASTRWDEIALTYDRLVEFTPNPVVAVNRAVALSFARGA